jgi:hypothetical protein
MPRRQRLVLLKTGAYGSQPFSSEMRQHAFNDSQQCRMGQTTRSLGISFTHEMWDRIEARYRSLKFGRSQYFQMLVEWDLHFMPEIHAHKSDGKWHLYPESSAGPEEKEHLRAAEDALPDAPREGSTGKPRRRRR